MEWRKAWALIESDLARRASYEGRPPGWRGRLLALLTPGGLGVAIARVEHYAHRSRRPLLEKLCILTNVYLFAMEVGPEAEIGEGLLVLDPTGVIINNRSRIGRNLVVCHQVAIGLKDPRPDEYVRLGDDVLVGPGARLWGRDVVIGDGSRIGANAVVVHAAPPRSLIAGVPAQIVGTLGPGTRIEVRQAREPDAEAPSLRTTQARMRADLVHRARLDGRPFSWRSYLKLPFNPSAMAVVLYRVQAWLGGRGLHLAEQLVADLNFVLYKVQIRSDAQIGGGLVIVHANGVAILGRARIGERCAFFHHNTVIGDPLRAFDQSDGPVVIEDDAMVGLGVRVVGDARIRRGSLVGANSAVEGEIPPSVVAAGVPARALRRIDGFEVVSPSVDPLAAAGPPPRWPSLRETIDLIREDIGHRAALERKPLDARYWAKVLGNPAALVVVSYRLQRWMRGAHLGLLARLLANVNTTLFTCELQSGAEIGGGLVLYHPNGVLICDQARIGRRCHFTLQVSITCGPRTGWDPAHDRVVLGDDVFVGMGARIVGNVTIGDRALIGTNAVVTRDAPADAVLVGLPARDVRTAGASQGQVRLR